MIVTLISLSCEDHMHASSRDVPSGDYLPLISKVWQSLWVYTGCPSLAPLPAAHCLLHLCVGSALHIESSTTLSAWTLLLFSVVSHCALLRKRSYWYLYADCYPTAPRLLCRWFEGLVCPPVAVRLMPVAHSALLLSGLKTTLFDWGWTGNTTLNGRYIKLL